MFVVEDKDMALGSEDIVGVVTVKGVFFIKQQEEVLCLKSKQ
jgi:hypothetical protein